MVDPVRIPLYTPAGNRELDTLKDARLVNCWVEKDSAGRVWVQKRPALVQLSQAAAAGTIGRGIFLWEGRVYGIFGGAFLRASTALDSWSALGAVSASRIYRATSNLGFPRQLFFHNGLVAYVYDGSSLLVVSDPDFPLNLVPGVALAVGAAYLDGTIYVTRGVGALIYGSNIDNALSWDPVNFLQARVEPDNAMFTQKHLVYVVVGKQYTTEFFHDAGNATGSPLASDPGLKMDTGCLAQNSIQIVGGDLIWLATTGEGSTSVVMLSNLRSSVVSTPAIERLIEGQGAEAANATSWSGKVGGHRLYGLSFAEMTLVYDITMGLWYEWTNAAGNVFPAISSTLDSTGSRVVLQGAADGRVYALELGTYVDSDGGAFPVDIYTPNWDGNARMKKTMSRLELVGDQVPGDFCTIEVTDDDYQTWNDERVIDRGVERQLLFNCGTFRRRAWHIHHKSDAPFRVQALEAQVLIGSL